MKYIGLTLFLLVCNVISNAGNVYTQFQNFSINNGLAHTQVNTITEDNRGYVWIGTKAGLNRFDGTSFITYKYDFEDESTIPANDVSKLLFSKTGTLVVGTWGEGVGFMDPISGKVQRLKNDLFVLDAKSIKSLFEDSDTTLWIGTFGGGVFKYNYKTKAIQKCIHQSPKFKDSFNYTQGIVEIKDTVYIVSNENGLGCIPRNSKVINTVLNTQGNSVFDGNLSSIAVDGNELFLGTYDGELIIFNTLTKKYTTKYLEGDSVSNGSRFISDILVDSKHMLWIATNGGVYKYDVEKDNVTFESNKKARVFTVFEDSRHIFWVGTWGKGIEKYDPLTMIFKTIDLRDFPSSNVISIAELKDSILALGTLRGIVLCDLKRGKLSFLALKGKLGEFVNNNIVRSIVRVDDYMLAVVQDDVYKIEYKKAVCEKHFISRIDKFKDTYFRDLCIDRVGKIWLSSWSDGFFEIKEKEGQYVQHSNDKITFGTQVHAMSFIYQSKSGDYWVGTKTGLLKFDNDNNVFGAIDFSSITDFPSQCSIYAIDEDDKGVLWLATSHGLLKYDYMNKNHKMYSEKNGLPSHVITGLKYYNKELWLSSSDGLIRFSLKDEHFEVFTENDGLLSNELALKSFVNTHPELFFVGTINGVNFFNPKSISSFYHESKAYINNFYIDNVLVEPGKTVGFESHISTLQNLKLNYDQNNLIFEFSAINFSHIQNTHFKYKLEGFDKTWVVNDFNDRRIKYTNLYPGTYVLRVCIVQANGKTSAETQLKIHIANPYWKQWWFMFAVTGFIISIVSLVVYVKTKRITRQKLLLEHRVAVRTAEVAEQKTKIEEMNVELLQSYSQLKSNVQYAHQIQKALLPTDKEVSACFEESFVYYEPKGIVSGDFYWTTQVNEHVVFAAIDCTGHGVSGAFMTILTNGILRDIVDHKHIVKPNEILDALQIAIQKTLNQKNNSIKDGMDISILSYDTSHQKISLASAMTPILLFKGNERIVIDGDRIQIGGDNSIEGNFGVHHFNIDEAMQIYLFSDGFYDQFGGDKDMKYKKSRFFDFIESNKDLSMYHQSTKLDHEFKSWKGNFPQVDDVMVVGIKLK